MRKSKCVNALTFVIGFYIGRRMHRPGLSELETLMEHAESLPVDGVGGQAYLRCADCYTVLAYLDGGEAASDEPLI